MVNLGEHWFRVDLRRETPAEIGPLLDRYAGVISGNNDARETWKKLKALDRLGVTRATLQMA